MAKSSYSLVYGPGIIDWGQSPADGVNIPGTQLSWRLVYRSGVIDWGWQPYGTIVTGDISGTLSTTDRRDVAVLSGGIVGSGTIATTERRDIASISGGVVVAGTIATTDSRDVAALSGSITASGTLSTTDRRDIAVISGNVELPVIDSITPNTGTTAGGTSFTISGSNFLTGDAVDFGGTSATGVTVVNSTTITGISPAGNGINVDVNVTRTGGITATLPEGWSYFIPSTLSTTDRRDIAALTGSVGNILQGTLSTTDQRDIASLSGSVIVAGTLLATDRRDTASIAGSILATGTLLTTDRRDIASLAGGILATGTLSTTDRRDTTSLAGGILATGTLSTTDQRDVASIFGSVSAIVGTLSTTDRRDTASFVGGILTTGTLSTTDRRDTVSISGQVIVAGTISSTDRRDTASISGGTKITGIISTTDKRDIAYFTDTLPFITVVNACVSASPSANFAFSGRAVVNATIGSTWTQVASYSFTFTDLATGAQEVYTESSDPTVQLQIAYINGVLYLRSVRNTGYLDEIHPSSVSTNQTQPVYWLDSLEFVPGSLILNPAAPAFEPTLASAYHVYVPVTVTSC